MQTSHHVPESDPLPERETDAVEDVERRAENNDMHGDEEHELDASEPMIEILEPIEGSVVSYSPWRVRMRTRGFQVRCLPALAIHDACS